MTRLPKYALLELERRWLVESFPLLSLEAYPYRRITDLYIQGTRLRLRKDEGEVVTYKLCKKYGRTAELAEPITNLYLTEAEYLVLAALPADELVKRRYAVYGGALDVYETLPSVVVFEMEFATEKEARAYQPPAFAGPEVTGDPTRTGAALAAGRREAEPRVNQSGESTGSTRTACETGR